jgi:hypothetical protein
MRVLLGPKMVNVGNRDFCATETLVDYDGYSYYKKSYSMFLNGKVLSLAAGGFSRDDVRDADRYLQDVTFKNSGKE